MALRMVQVGRGKSRPVVVGYMVFPSVDARLRSAFGPDPCIIMDDSDTGSSLWQAFEMAFSKAGVESISRLGLIGFSAGCQRIRSLYRDEEVRAHAYLLVDGTHASLPPEASEIAWLQHVGAEARAGQTMLVASHTLQTYVEELPADERFASTLRVLRMATGFNLDEVGPLEAPRITQSGNLWVYSYTSGKSDAKAHVDQHEWALPALAAAHMAPALTGQVYAPAETKGSGGGLGLALLAAGVVWAVG
jgi:hypothetical protein